VSTWTCIQHSGNGRSDATAEQASHPGFKYQGKPIGWANTRAWRQALARAGIEDFRWHDLRHTWASWHVQRGTPLNVVQEMGAWESESMVRRYAHLAPAHLRQHAEVLTEVLNDTNTAQASNEKGLALS
jgi:integrase